MEGEVICSRHSVFSHFDISKSRTHSIYVRDILELYLYKHFSLRKNFSLFYFVHLEPAPDPGPSSQMSADCHRCLLTFGISGTRALEVICSADMSRKSSAKINMTNLISFELIE